MDSQGGVESIAGERMAGESVAGQMNAGDCRQAANACAMGFSCQLAEGDRYECVPESVAGEAIAGETAAGEELGGDNIAGQVAAGETTAGETNAGAATAGEGVAGEGGMGGDMAGKDVNTNPSNGPCKDSASGCPEIEWISLEGADFTMGSDAGAGDEQPVHRVSV